MYLYHGTSVENASKILANRELKGKKAFNKHNNRYVAFSKSLFVARQFGEVVFRFEDVANVTEVEYENEEWLLSHEEIVEFLLKDTITGENTELLEMMNSEKEYVLKNKLDFTNKETTIYLLGEKMNKLTAKKNMLQPHLNDTDKVIKSVKKYEDFLNWL